MQTGSHKTRTLIITIIVIVLLTWAIYIFFLAPSAPAVTTDEYGNPVAAQVVGQDLVDLLGKLQAVKLDDSIFQNQAFIKLTDDSVPLPVIPQGRANPFQPIPGSAISNSSSAR